MQSAARSPASSQTAKLSAVRLMLGWISGGEYYRRGFARSRQSIGDALPAPEIIAAEIADDLEAALEQFSKIAARLGQAAGANGGPDR
jgi:hypothetical protein